MGGNEAYVRRDTEFRVGERAREGSHHRGFVGVVAVQVGGFDLQGDVFLVAQLDHGDVVLPVTATINSKNKARLFHDKQTKKNVYAFTVRVERSFCLQVSSNRSDTTTSNCSHKSCRCRSPLSGKAPKRKSTQAHG